MTSQATIKTIIEGVGALIDARIKTSETNIRAEIRDLRQEMNELRSDIKGVLDNHEERLDLLEQTTGIHSHKH